MFGQSRLLLLVTAAATDFLATATAEDANKSGKYMWSITWTGERVCPSWPCPYSYNLRGSPYSIGAQGEIPSFHVSCEGMVDNVLKSCKPMTVPAINSAIKGNFSSFETSGVSSGVIFVSMEWYTSDTHQKLTLTGKTLKEINGTWEMQPEGCGLTGHCVN